MFKKTTSFLLIIALLFGILTMLPQNAINFVNADEYTFKEDSPSDWAKEIVYDYISQGKVPEALQRSFKRSITVGEYAELEYNFKREDWDDELFERITIADNSIDSTAPDYIKRAFITGFINDADELSKTMTREEAASRLISANTALNRSDKNISLNYTLKVSDYNNISPDRVAAAAVVIEEGVIPVINNAFLPKNPFTVEQAIAGMKQCHQCDFVLGLIPQSELHYVPSIVVQKNSVALSFSQENDYLDYIYSYVSPRLGDLEISNGYEAFDVGYMIIELNSNDFNVKYTLKNDVCNVYNFDDCNDSDEQPTYGIFNYKSEPRKLKPSEKPNLTIQLDTVHKKLYPKLNAILKKIIKPKMTQGQKLKAIHDYVVKNISYSGNSAYVNGENALKAIETKKGVCGDYTALFYYLCKRASIPVISIEGYCATGYHAWNLVYTNKQWLHVDTTWDDPKNKTIYSYYLKSTDYMMQTHLWSGFNYPDHNKYAKIDGMKIKTTKEFQLFILQQLSDGFQKTIKFRVLNKNVNTDYKFMRLHLAFGYYTMKYDVKANIYTLSYHE